MMVTVSRKRGIREGSGGRGFHAAGAVVPRYEEAFFPGLGMDVGRWEGLRLSPKVFWRSRGAESVRFAAGLGVRAGLDEVCGWLGSGRLVGLRFYGGRQFFDEAVAGEGREERLGGEALTGGGGLDGFGKREFAGWEGWPAEFVFAPVLEVECGPEGALVRLLAGAKERAKAGWRSCQDAARALLRPGGVAGGEEVWGEGPRVVERRDVPDWGGWVTAVNGVLGRIAEGVVDKVGLARVTRLVLEAPVAAFELAARLAAEQPGCSQFCFEVVPGMGAFLGSTPERLFLREGRLLRSEAVAGTRTRGVTPEEDAVLEAELVASGKDRAEHGVVVEALAQGFERLCERGWLSSGPEVMRLAQVRHLRTRFEGVLRAGVDDGLIVRVLHPTPATCGAPREAALAVQRAAERWVRGWYAAPLLCLEPERAEALVAIRSARVRGQVAEVYAGAGIVEGSEPKKEWQELESKAAGFLSVFGGVRLRQAAGSVGV